MRRGRYRSRSPIDSYVEVRFVVFAFSLIAFVGSLLPAIVRAVDLNGDNLDDTWETQYGITTNAYAATNLVGWWQMDGGTNVVDRTTNHLDGAMQGFATNAFVSGLFGKALDFEAASTVTFPVKPPLNLTNAFTFAAWIKIPSDSASVATIAQWTDTSANSWTVRVATGGIAQIQFRHDSGHVQNDFESTPSIDPVLINDGAWHHIAATWKAPHEVFLYVDGECQSFGFTDMQAGTGVWTPHDVASFSLGETTSAASFLLDEVRLYNRALGPKEITQLPVTYSDLSGNGVSVFEAEQRGLNPYEAFPPVARKISEPEKKPDAATESDSGWSAWMTHSALDKFIDALDPSSVGKHPNFWDKGHWITGVEGRWRDNHIEYRISYGPVPKHKHYGWYWWINQPEDVFKKRDANYVAHGFALQHSNSFSRPTGEKRMQGVWHWLQPPDATGPAAEAEVKRALEENKPQQL